MKAMKPRSQQVEQSLLLEQIMSSLQSRDFNKALFYCQKTNEFSQTSSVFSALIKSILGVIQLYSNNYVEAIQHFNQGLEIIESAGGKQAHQSTTHSVTIKLFGNLLLSYIFTSRSHEAIQLLNRIFAWIQTLKCQKPIFQQLIYVLFRVTKLQSIGSVVALDNQLYDQPTKACLLSAASLNSQVINNIEEAYKLQQSSLKIWKSLKDSQQIVFSLRRLVCLATQLRNEQQLDRYQNELESVLQQNSGQFEIEKKTLFKGYRQKIKILKELMKMLHRFDSEYLGDKEAIGDEVPQCWKLATKLRLKKTLKEIKSTTTPKGKENLNQIQYIMECANNLGNQTNKLVQNEIKKSSFVKASINLLSNHLTNLVIHCGKMRISVLKDGFQNLVEFKPKPRQPLHSLSIQNIPKFQTNKEFNLSVRTKTPTASKDPSRKQSISSRSPFHSASISLLSKQDQKLNKKYSKYLRMCEVGQYLQKKNFSNDSGDLKFVKVTKNEIRWAGDDEKIDKESKYHSYNLKQVRGILYGKFSQTFKKSSNKNLDSWRCFSLVLQKRTLDFYCENEAHVEFWITGISSALKRVSPNSDLILYTPGRQRWRKMFLKLTQSFIDPMKKQERLHHNDVAMAVILFGRHNYKLPK